MHGGKRPGAGRKKGSVNKPGAGTEVATRPAKVDPPPDELERMTAADERNKARGVRVRTEVVEKTGDDGSPVFTVGPDGHDDRRGWLIRLTDAFGSSGDDFAFANLNNLMKASRVRGSGDVDNTRLNALISVVEGAKPANEIEAMLVSQMVAVHFAAMDSIALTSSASTVQARDVHSNAANKLMRTFTTQVEALAKLRRGGNQTVRVEHVHVHNGGQAIVGNVTHGGGTEGVKQISEGQAHVSDDERTLGLALGAEVWSENPAGQPVPACAGQR